MKKIVSSLGDIQCPDEEHDLFESDLSIRKQISQSVNPIFLGSTTKSSDPIAIKVYPYEDSSPSKSFLNETRYLHLEHKNVIKYLGAHTNPTLKNIKGSVILMELAKCDFVDAVDVLKIHEDEKLARTFFHQIIEGVEFLHSQGIIHMDIKPENILLGYDCQAKLADFDKSFTKGDKKFSGCGTMGFRAPELIEKNVRQPEAVDIFACAIVLFVMRFGYLPYTEDEPFEGIDLFNALLNNPQTFWEFHGKMKKLPVQEEKDFIDLINGMTRPDVKKRWNVEDIKRSRWYRKGIYNRKELNEKCEKSL